MKATELMIGDWVYNSKNERCKVCGTSEIFDSNITLDNYDKENDGCFETEFEVSPIPLTKEILEQNKVRYQFGMPWYQGGADGVFEFRYRSDDDTIEIRKAVRYVHELQHILKECEIYNEIEL